ncbi:Exocyst complex component SEC3A [Glycine soja]|uniref:Exocyst complex component SEC3A n=1 Tax=Glycine soja TaxID=3848 RepID=A0A445HRD5_GLYSO|nr:Exocyst complex component SEC3A [Glycine soja]
MICCMMSFWVFLNWRSLSCDCNLVFDLRMCLGHIYCSWAREFANELRASTKASRNPTVWLEGSTGSGQNVNATYTSTVSDAYAKMLTIFIPLLVDESSFFAHFMCFEVSTLVPPGGKNSAELEALNKSLKDLLDGIQEDFYAVVDWAYKIDPLRCISMHGMTERYLSGQKADAAGFVRDLLRDLESRISMQFNRFVDEACHQIERNERNVRQMGVLSYIPSFTICPTWAFPTVHPSIEKLSHLSLCSRAHLIHHGLCPSWMNSFSAWTVKNGSLEDVKIQFIWGMVDKSIAAMYKKLQKNLTSEELLPSFWDKCKEFLDKYESFVQLVAKIYPTETILSVAEMRDLLASM